MSFDTKDAIFSLFERWDKWPDFIPKEVYSLETGKMEPITLPFAYINEHGHLWYVDNKPITSISI